MAATSLHSKIKDWDGYSGRRSPCGSVLWLSERPRCTKRSRKSSWHRRILASYFIHVWIVWMRICLTSFSGSYLTITLKEGCTNVPLAAFATLVITFSTKHYEINFTTRKLVMAQVSYDSIFHRYQGTCNITEHLFQLLS